MQTDQHYMQQALRLGRFGCGQTAPNPAVGCVIVAPDGTVVGTGFTRKNGRPHAESEALAQAGIAAKGATAYVSLEPCAHQGKTPPCAQSLIDAQIARVVYAIDDPDPRVNGGGAAMLRKAGLKVESGVLADDAQSDHLGFLLSKSLGRAMVTLKLALSANGFMRTPAGQDKWITGHMARQMGHKLRAQNDAIITGSGTLCDDDPSLDCRLPGLQHASPVPVIMGRSDLPADSILGKRCAQDEVLHYRDESPAEVVSDLAKRGMTRILLECGPTLAAAFLQADLVDELAVFVAPHEVVMDGESDISRMKLDYSAFVETLKSRADADIYTHYRRKGERL